MKIVDDILDLAGFVLLAGACFLVAFNIVLPMTREELSSGSSLVDKTAPTIQGYTNSSDFDGSMSKLEVVLMSQVQDFGVPDPKRFVVGDETIEVTSSYRGDLPEVGVLVYNQLNTTDPEGDKQYEVRYMYGTSPSSNDDYYAVLEKE